MAEVDAPPYLPDELITKILVRLPVKSLIRFKSVCKSWFSLISDNHFANSHFQVTAATHTLRILFLTATPEFRYIAVDSLFTDDYNEPVPLNPNFPLPEFEFDLEIKASCRGFIYVHTCSEAYIWNPSTGFLRQIPFPPNVSNLIFYGFGYDESTDDYLVVSVYLVIIMNLGFIYVHTCSEAYIWNPSTGFLRQIPFPPNVSNLIFYGFGYDESTYDYLVVSVSYVYLGIFSLRANAWNEIVSPTHLPFCSKSSPFVYPLVESVFNGAIHWLAFNYDTHEYLVVAFELVERKLVEIPLPDDFDHGYTVCGLWVCRGFLSLWVMVDEDTVDIWVMKEYKVQSSWTKTLVLTTYDTIHNVSLVCCTTSGDIVGTDSRTGLVRYDEEGEFLEHTYYCKDSRNGFRLAMYTESLLSLPSDNEEA
ncbi:putative F-box domain, galactose oxidase/kelch, beta-propeller, F-box associated interaction [Medicago truncatula]|uniref:Putative F-box domain, galactose oxidase/kelch, beta-propeller, F-box associated interaction n=1 Tax=Medicago truncatula TaxID=3880 RepID=A0A396JXF5_MEDTR|nr:putative F-box domain, galactose oxidase/kelch, beta-propeller, F-box associated interaction [Medicago truncatula]